MTLLILCIASLTVSISSQYICPASHNASLKNFHFHGTALGGWLVLEPWLTPSLFYQFLGASEKWGDDAKNKVGLDSYTFCTALGAKEANRQLRRHWDTWVTEDHIANLAKMGVDTVRIPVADWMYIPYEPYVGCWDGALDQLHRVLGICQKYGIGVMLDLHAMRDSQNGLDNSGMSQNIEWIGYFSRDNVTRYRHWDIRAANWVGKFNVTAERYDLINAGNIAYSLAVVAQIVETHHADPTVVALEPVNEPSDTIPLDLLKHFYWESYSLVQARAPHWITVFHDAFRLTPENWVDFMPGCPNYAFDSHIYQAWADAAPMGWFQDIACRDGRMITTMESLGIPVIVGEWSLAVDNCAMWLNGLNDNVWGYPKVQCELVTCPDPYFGPGVVPNAPPDPTKGVQDPLGTGPSYVEYGRCPRDHVIEDEDKEMRTLGMAKLWAFDTHTHGQFFWNFRTEFEPRWDFMEAVRRGWLPSRGVSRSASSPEERKAVRAEAMLTCSTAHSDTPSPPPAGDNSDKDGDLDPVLGGVEPVLGGPAATASAKVSWSSRSFLQSAIVCSSSAALLLFVLLRRVRGGRDRAAGPGYHAIPDQRLARRAAMDISMTPVV